MTGIAISASSERNGRCKVLADDPYNIWKNDCIEAYWERPDGSVYQLVADVRGAKRAGVNYKGVNCDEVKVSSRVMPGKGFVIFIAVPWTTLKVDSPDAGKRSSSISAARVRAGSRNTATGDWARDVTRNRKISGLSCLAFQCRAGTCGRDTASKMT